MPAGPAHASIAPSAQLQRAQDRDVLVLGGSWRLSTLPEVDRALAALKLPPGLSIDASGVTEIDSAAALALLNRVAAAGTDVNQLTLDGFAANEARIVEQVRRRLREVNEPVRRPRERLLAHVGRETLADRRSAGGTSELPR